MSTPRKNIVLIVADQLSAKALRAYGNTDSCTPAVDELIRNGTSLENCCTACPLCQPSRAAFWTSRWPHELEVESNGRNWPVKAVGKNIPTLGERFSKAGYEAVHFGKRHDAGALRGFSCGEETTEPFTGEAGLFLNDDSFEDRATSRAAQEYLRTRFSSKPLLLAVDFVNPHNICGWVGRHTEHGDGLPEGMKLPPLPENFDFPDIANRPRAVQYICCSHVRQAQAAGWTTDDFRQYLAAYYAYLAMVDEEIGAVLKAAKETLDPENTVYVFFSDHGDSMAARGRVTKQVDFYEEVACVPLAFCGAGIPQGKRIKGVASLLDIFPTLCELAELPIPDGVRGVSLKKCIFEEKEAAPLYAASEWRTEWGYTVSPGRMIRTEHWKYIAYVEDHAEELYDLQTDPGETKNLAYMLEYQQRLAEMQMLLKKQLADTADPFWSLPVSADLRWRTHAVGYANHKGVAAPQA